MRLRLSSIFPVLILVLVLLPLSSYAAGYEKRSSASSPASIMVSSSDRLGPILTDSQGRTLYVWEKDSPGASECYDGCAKAWPPLTVDKGESPIAAAPVSGKLGVIERTDGSYQVTYENMPLYYFIKDQKPGDVTGQDVGPAGGKWYVVPPQATTFAEAETLSEKMTQK